MADVDINIGTTAKSKRPSDSNFKQQRLPAWQPVLTAGSVLPTFFVIGIAFIPVGAALLFFSDKIAEHITDYTDCLKYDNLSKSHLNYTCAEQLMNNSFEPCQCKIDFTLNKDFGGKIYMYYGLSNYYQNHRRYVKSRDDDQLLGVFSDRPSSDCAPFDVNSDGKQIVPCGAIANSLFNDSLYFEDITHHKRITLNNTGIAWPSDKKMKFKNPEGDLKKVFSNYARPLHWTKDLWDLDSKNPENNGLQNEDLIVWMRTAALPSFRKLYRIVETEHDGLFTGNYTLYVDYNYPVKQFEGRKTFILSTTSLLGGKNPFLGYAYIVVGSICLLLGIVLLIIHIKYSKTSSTGITSVNPRTPYS